MGRVKHTRLGGFPLNAGDVDLSPVTNLEHRQSYEEIHYPGLFCTSVLLRLGLVWFGVLRSAFC